MTGGYRYETDPSQKDFGHILQAELLNPDNPIHPQCKYASASLRKTMRYAGRLWNLDRYKKDMKRLIQAVEDGKQVNVATTEAQKMLSIYDEVTETLEKGLRAKFQGTKFEFIIKGLLEQIYPNNVAKTASRNEKGADFIYTVDNEFGIPIAVAVQVKMWEGEADWTRPLQQIEEAYNNPEYENIAAGLVIMTAESGSQGFEKERRELEQKLGIPITVFYKDEFLRFLLRHLTEFVDTMKTS